MTFSSPLAIANSGLQAAQARAKTAANNIANATTEGYSARRTDLIERRAGGEGAGVSVLGEVRITNPFVTQSRLSISADAAFTGTRAETAEQIAIRFGEPGSDAGIFGALTRFESALRTAAASPEEGVLLTSAVDDARALTTEFNRLSETASNIRFAADREIGEAVGQINQALERIADLNKVPVVRLTPAIEDERQQLTDLINEFIPVKVNQRDNVYQLTTEGGVVLVAETPRTLEFSANGAVGRDQTLGDGLSGVTVNGIDITPGGGAPQAAGNGQLAALFERRDATVPAFLDQLDGLAEDLITRFADPSVDGTIAADAPGLFTVGPELPVAGELGLATRIRINAAVDPQQGGDVTLLRDGLGATEAGPEGSSVLLDSYVSALNAPKEAPVGLGLAGRYSTSELAAALSSTVNRAQSQTADAALFSSTRLDIAVEEEQGQIGVDVDRELQSLIQIEQAYAANARVIQTVQQMVNTLLEII